MLGSIPDYGNLDLSGEAKAAAQRMEARAQEPSSEAMFNALIAPLLDASTQDVLDIGCGTGALARRIAAQAPQARVLATDKSEVMLQVGALLASREGRSNASFKAWDAMDEAAFPDKDARFDLIVSSVMIIYLEEAQAEDLVQRLAKRLKPGGVLAFMEQDLYTDAVNDPSGLFSKVMQKDARSFKKTQSLGLRASLTHVGLALLPRRSYLWTDDHYGPYTRELLERIADANLVRGGISANECQRFKQGMDEQAKAGDFYYGLVYHCVAGKAA